MSPIVISLKLKKTYLFILSSLCNFQVNYCVCNFPVLNCFAIKKSFEHLYRCEAFLCSFDVQSDCAVQCTVFLSCSVCLCLTVKLYSFIFLQCLSMSDCYAVSGCSPVSDCFVVSDCERRNPR